MQYALLREEGLKHIQALAGKIWTDENAHDPGITILEVLAYAITDLGYRTNYNIKDILTTNPDIPEDIKNFFQAKEIMPNYPVTFKDYRKLMIDVEIPVVNVQDCTSLGIKNAWIEISDENEIPFYLDTVNKTLSYVQPDPSVAPTRPKVLYDVLLEFNSCEGLGDLNANTIEDTFSLYLKNTTPDIPSQLNGIKIKMEVEFPRWDTPGVDWSSTASIQANMRGIVLDFIHLPEGYKVDSYGLDNAGLAYVVMSLDIINPVDTTVINAEINERIYSIVNPLPLIERYQQKVQQINNVLAAVRARLMANRNLGEDFFRYNAIKVDEIALCADIDVVNNAVVEQVQAQIFHEVEKFLDPEVFFYSLSEMYAKGKTTDQIFEGPLLEHGFIDDADLAKAERRKTIHVSDLINIIMDIPGVVAVKNIQIAGIPLDNDDNIPTDIVKWCLEVPLEKNYVPRLTVERSKLIFFKDQLPYHANAVIAQEILDELERNDRPQKLTNPDYDIHLAPGEYKDIENYYSIQDEFPVVYGIGTPGLPETASTERRAQARQLKGYLLFFDQLLADYLSQLFHVKDLFSMNEAKGPDGNPLIDKTYFSQSLVNIVPDAAPLYVDALNNPAQLQAITEDVATYDQRRNRFLDHLMARFSESFSDYAMVVYKIDGPKAPEDLIQDKLEFLNNYPLISSARDTGFNYKKPCRLWSIDNISGLERRVSYLCGVDKPLAASLAFSASFDVRAAVAPDEYYFAVENQTGPRDLVYSPGGPATGFPSIEDAKYALESLITIGLSPENYVMYNGNNDVITDPLVPGPSPYRFEIICDEIISGVNAQSYPVAADFIVMQQDIADAIQIITDEFYDNPESNRYNLECFMDKYVITPLSPIITGPVLPCPEKYTWLFTLQDGDPDFPTTLLVGQVEALAFPPVPAMDQAFENKERLLMDMLRAASDIANYRFGFDPSDPTMEVFTVVDRCGDFLGQSFEEDFNQHIQSLMQSIQGMSSPDNEFQVVSSTGNDGSYVVTNITIDLANARRLKVTVDSTQPLPSPIADGFIRIDIDSTYPALQPTVIDANIAENYFEVNKSLNRILFPGNTLHVNSGPDMGTYTVIRVVPSGLTNSFVYVKEKIVSTNPASPTIDYTLLLPITSVDLSTNDLFITPGADEIAAQELADWVKLKFFSHEGMHVIEHVLLRPKYNTLGPQIPISPANNNEIQNVTPGGSVNFIKQFALTNVNQGLKQFTFAGSFAGDVQPLQSMRIVNSPANNNTYTIRSSANVAGSTVITIYENIPDATIAGDFQYSKTLPIVASIPPNEVKIVDPFFVTPLNNDVIITGSFEEINDGRYHLSSVIGSGPAYKLDFDTRIEIIKDDFLPVDIDNPCGFCKFDDPYSYIVSIVLPAWQGRFVQQDFRKFFDRTLRLECPAHLVLNICWIECKQMGEFEAKYKKWLIENAKQEPVISDLSKDLNALIGVINKLRSVYPEGTLHDCETDSGEENAIILNNTVLGTL
jgi:cell fate (sporulation/competence/biofilm development) regulator YmcA (YheA/YmcA/DUF963 family)